MIHCINVHLHETDYVLRLRTRLHPAAVPEAISIVDRQGVQFLLY